MATTASIPAATATAPARLDIGNAADARQALLTALASGAGRLDLSAVVACDLAGLQLLLAAAATVRGNGGALSFHAPSPAVTAAASAFGVNLAAQSNQS